jgi:hypothetical protein
MGWQRASADLFAGCKTLLDVKTLGPGRKYALFPIKSSSAVEQRAQEVPKDYRKAVRKIDRKNAGPRRHHRAGGARIEHVRSEW